MQSHLTLSVLLGLAVASVASAQQAAAPIAVPGGDTFSVNCSALIPGGDMFSNGQRRIDDELPEGIPGGDMFDQGDIPGGGGFDPMAVPGGDTFVQTCFESFRELDLLIPGGDMFDPEALARVASGELEIGEFPEWTLSGDQRSLQQIVKDASLGVDGLSPPIIPQINPAPDPQAIPGGDMFEPPAQGQPMSQPQVDNQGTEPVSVADACDWTGTWSSSYGDMRIIHSGGSVTGDLPRDGRLTGSVDGACILKGEIAGGAAGSDGARVSFTLSGERFTGYAQMQGQTDQRNWSGTRRSKDEPTLRSDIAAQQTCSWTGTWSSSYGDLRLVQDGQRVSGDYANRGTIEGTLGADCALDGNFENVRGRTSGTFAFKLDGDRFEGLWGYDGRAQSDKWGGTRRSSVKPVLTNQNMAEAACDWTGTWSSSIGDLRFVQNGNQVSGQHRTDGQISATADACRLEGTIENQADEKRRDFTITKSDRRFDGTWGWQDSTSFGTNIWSGTLRSAEAPVISQPVTRAPSTPQEVPSAPPPEPVVNEPKKEMTRTWRVTLHAACLRDSERNSDARGLRLIGIAWVKARVTHKQTGEEITLAPIGGFPNLNDDKERVFEQAQDSAGLETYVFDSRCALFTQSGFARNDHQREMPEPPIFVDFEIDAERFGYDDIEELLSNRKNRLRVMTKLGGTQRLGFDSDFGTKARSTPLADASFCGSCKLNKDKQHEDGTFAYSMSGNPTGNGVLSGFRDAGDEAAVFYDIKPLE